jgi:superfamily II DNA/RNA helicase/cold shock CspA family protein
MTTTFADLGVPAELVSTLKARGILAPFAIQTLTVADGCAGRDLCGRAPTGSGKTIAFGIPLAMRVSRAAPKRPTGLVLVPTRELAAQVCGELEWLGRQRKLRVAAVYGGAGFGLQLKALRRGVDVLVACPGRLTDLMERGEVRLDAVEIVVVDEADRMADMGFLPVVQRLLDTTPKTRQTLLFSATLDGAVDTLVRRYQRDPVRHSLPESSVDKPRATHLFWSVHPDKRVELCADVIKLAGPTIVFCKTKRGTDRIAKRLDQAGVRTEAIHGNRSQSQRERALAAFARGKVDALVATDVAARGIHVDSVACVVHFDPPNDAKDYMHRSGRTARAGEAGTVVSFVGNQQAREAAQLQQALGMRRGLERPDRDALASLTPDAVNRREPLKTASTVAPPAASVSVDALAAVGDTAAGNRGAIKWFDAKKGFGFIERPDGNDLFVHFSSIEGGLGNRLAEGQLVDYEVGPGRKGPEAQNVRLLATAAS